MTVKKNKIFMSAQIFFSTWLVIQKHDFFYRLCKNNNNKITYFTESNSLSSYCSLFKERLREREREITLGPVLEVLLLCPVQRSSIHFLQKQNRTQPLYRGHFCKLFQGGYIVVLESRVSLSSVWPPALLSPQYNAFYGMWVLLCFVVEARSCRMKLGRVRDHFMFS